MRRLTLLSIAVLVLMVLPAHAQQTLPAQVSGWPQTAGVTPVPALPSGSPILAEYGWRSTESASYGTTSRGIEVVLFEMGDPSGAYGLYSYLRTAELARANLTDHSSMSGERALVLAGNLVLDIHGQDLGQSTPQLRALVAAVEPKAHDGTLPMLGAFLPQKNMIDRTDRYVLGPQTLNQLFPGGLGDSLGFQSRAEAELAHYRLGGHDAILLVVEFPTDQLASRQLVELERNLHVNDASQVTGSPVIFAKRSATLLAIVSGASSQAEANTLLDQIQIETDRSWNEPTFQFKEPSIGMMIVGSIIGAGTICLFALIAGISFGGLRLVIKRVMPGKIFDTKNHLEVLQLGLGSKPINSDDFYGYSAPTAPGAAVDKNLPDRVAMRLFR
ncbi:MAG TPA: DUF6599 family protein [Candidatus Cybelea sp.]|jgi:hypothetical protein|nr:DUF6599 family protein [Candidatus Cybelea sp.]